MHAGEFVHYQANFLRLFGGTRSREDVDRISETAVALRELRIAQFDDRLRSIRAFFEEQGAAGLAPPRLAGWDVERIDRLRRAHGGLLLAVFHYGEHRQVLSDLCCLGVPFVAPVAKQSYFDAPAAFAKAPRECADAAVLLEVESRNVGRRLLTELRRGRIGLIYVDGNMGPDGHLVTESAVEIDFLGERIRVKSGIARLAAALRLPILPILPAAAADANRASALVFAPEVVPFDDALAGDGKEAQVQRTMQACYDALAAAVADSPADWEFAFCLHRWLSVAADDDAGTLVNGETIADTQRIRVDTRFVLPYAREDGMFWLHVGRQRAYRMPEWSRELYRRLQERPMTRADVVALLSRNVQPTSETESFIDQLGALRLIETVA